MDWGLVRQNLYFFSFRSIARVQGFRSIVVSSKVLFFLFLFGQLFYVICGRIGDAKFDNLSECGR